MLSVRLVLPRLHLAAVVAALLLGTLLVPSARADSLDPPDLGVPAADSNVKGNPTFTWAPVARASKYRIQVSTTAAFSSVTYTAEVSGTTATPVNELPLGTLHWHVAALDGAKVLGTYSPTRSFTRIQADAPEPTTPANGASLAYPFDPAVLSWKPVPGIQTYKVEIDDESTFTAANSYTTPSTSLAFPTMLQSGLPRFWRVQGISTASGVTTAWSDAAEVSTFTIGWPAAAKPTLVAPADSLTIDRDDFEFSWTSVPGAAKYEIEFSTAEDFTAQVTRQVTAATRFRPLATMAQDQYYWHVRALQPNGDPSGWSDAFRFKREWLDVDGLTARPTVTIADADPLVSGVQLEAGRISLSWTPVRGASQYELDISTDPAFLAQSAPTSMVRRTCSTPHTQWTPYLEGTYTETTGFGLCAWTGTPGSQASTRFIKPGTPYYVRVRALDDTTAAATRTSLWSNAAREGEGAAPATQSFEVVAPAPGGTNPLEPAVLVSSPDSADTPKLTWQRVDGAQAYLVGLARDSSFNNRVVLEDYFATPNTEFVLNQVLLDNSAGQPYFWFVLPCKVFIKLNDPGNVCEVGESQAINIAGRFASFNKLGKAVQGLTAAGVQTDTVALSWQDQLTTSPDGGGVSWYELEVRNAADAVVDTVRTDATGYSPIDKSYADGQYTWRVRAIDGAGKGLAWSAGSPASTFQKRSSVPVPQAPAASSTLPVLRWTPTSFAGSYDVEVYRGTDPAFPAGSKVASAGAAARKYPAWTPSAGLPADTYSWRVRQVDAYNKPGPWSTEVLPFTIGGQKPSLLSPADGAAAPVTSLVFDWSDVPGAVRYRFESSTTPGFGSTAESVTTTGSVYAPTGSYVGGTTYYWRVAVLNAASDTLATSDPIAFTPQTAPLISTATAKATGPQIDIAWQKPGTGGSPLTGYILRYRAFGDTTWIELDKAADVLSTALTDLGPNQKYEAQVAAQNAVGVGPFSTTVSATTPAPPAAPTSLVLTPAVRSLGATWRAPSSGGAPITRYVVRVTPSAGGAPAETFVTTPSTTLTGLADSTAYSVDVAAENDMGRGPFNSVEATTLPAPPPPDTAISSGPANGSTIGSRSASFAFTGSPTASTAAFECKLDDGAFATCTSPKSLTNLADGEHTLLVRAVDSYGAADETPAQRTFSVDVTAPDTRVDSAPDASTTEKSAAFTYSASPAADLDHFECKLDTGAFATCPATQMTYANLAPGTHTFSVRAVDRAKNADPTPASHSWTIAAPGVTPTPTATPTPSPSPTGPGTPGGDQQTDKPNLASGLGSVPAAATVSKDGKSISMTLPAGALPTGASLSYKLTGVGAPLAGKTLGTGRTTVRAGAVTKITIKLTQKARKALKKKRKLKGRLTVTATAPGATTATKSGNLTLKARARR